MKPSIKGIWTIGMIALFIVFLVSSCIFDDWLNPKRTGTARPTVTIVPDQPSYIGQNLRILVTMTPRQNVDFIRLVTVNGFTGERRLVAEQNNVNQAEFSLTIDLARFAIVVETPFHTEALDKGIWKPSKNAYYELRDSTPPSVALSVIRVEPSTNEHRVVLDIQEPHSQVIAQWIMVNGQRIDMTEEEIIIPLHPGDYTVVGYARNSSHIEGRSRSLTMRVAPPQSSAPPRYDLKTPANIEAFLNETVFLMVDIEDSTSFLRSVEIIHSQGGRRVFNFDPLEMRYALRYSFRATKDETVEVIITNGNGVTAVIRFFITVKDHQAPAIILSSSHSGQVPTDSEVIAQIQAMAFNNERIKEVFFLVNNYTQRSFFPNQTTFSKTDLNHTVTRGLQTLRVVAVDTRGARGYSDQIEIIGTIVDDEPPSVQLFAPPVAYLNVPVNVAFLVWDRDSDIDGSPKLTADGENLVPTTFDGSFFTASWTPKSLGVKTIRAEAKDTAGNTGFAVGTVEVKDPTGIVKPAIGLLGVEPNPVFLGNPVQITLNITPPQNFPGQRPKSVTFHISPPDAQGSHSITPHPVEGENIYRATYAPTRTGTHIASAEIWWEGSKYTADPIPFMVQSPEPTLDFSVTPTETYVGNDITLRLIASPTNPNAQIVSAEMFVEGSIVYPSGIDQRSGQKIYQATVSTLNYGAGQKTAMARVTDSFGQEQEKPAVFTLVEPTLRIDGWNIHNNSSEGLIEVMHEVRFDVKIAPLIPKQVPVEGRIEITSENGILEKTIDLVRIEDYSFESRPLSLWVPKHPGTYQATITMEANLGTKVLKDEEGFKIEVKKPTIGIAVSSETMSINNLFIGIPFDLKFSVTGLPEGERPQRFVFAIIRDGAGAHVPETEISEYTSINDGKFVFEYDIHPFIESGGYTIRATVTSNLSNSTETLHHPINVGRSQVQKKAFTLFGNPSALTYGTDIFFDLELDNPDEAELSVVFYLVTKDADGEYQRIPNISPITALSNDNYQTFGNVRPFKLNFPTDFTAAADVVLVSTPSIPLPTMYGDSMYKMPEPNLSIQLVNPDKEYLKGFFGSLDLIVTFPDGTEIQPPVIKRKSGSITINPIPYWSDVSDPSIHTYRYKVKPNSLDPIELEIALYEKGDVNQLNHLLIEEFDLKVIDFEPTIVIQSKTGGDEFIHTKKPEVMMEVTPIPEFGFENAQYDFRVVLTTTYHTEKFIQSNSPTSEAGFDAETLFNLEDTDTAKVRIVADISQEGESFTALGEKDFDVRLPKISIVDFANEAFYFVNSPTTISGSLINSDFIMSSNLVMAELQISEENKDVTKSYPTPQFGTLVLDPNVSTGSVQFINVIFEDADKDHQATLTVYYLRPDNKRSILAQTPKEIKKDKIRPQDPSIRILYPGHMQELYVGQLFEPSVELVGIPDPISVKIKVYYENEDNLFIEEADLKQNVFGFWELPVDTIKLIGPFRDDSDEYTMVVNVQCNIIENISPAERDFKVIPGKIELERMDIGERQLVEEGSEITLTVVYTYDNIFKDPITNVKLESGRGDVVLIDSEVQNLGDKKRYVDTYKITPEFSSDLLKDEIQFFEGGIQIGDSVEIFVFPIITATYDIQEEVYTGGSIEAYVLFSYHPALHTYLSDQGKSLGSIVDATINMPNVNTIVRTDTPSDTGDPAGRWTYEVKYSGTAGDLIGVLEREYLAQFNIVVNKDRRIEADPIKYKIIKGP